MDMGNHNTTAERKFIKQALTKPTFTQILLTLNEIFESINVTWRGEPFFTHQIIVTNDENHTYTIRYGWDDKLETWVFELL